MLTSHFRAHLLTHHFDNMVFEYTSDRVAMAESMAGNLQCLGCPAWVPGNEITPYLSPHDAKKFDPAVLASIRFFHQEQQYYRDAELVADVGVLSTYANAAYGPAVTRKRWAPLTQVLYQGKVPFTIVPDRYPGNLSRFRVLILPDVALISDNLVKAVLAYFKQGGGLVVTGETALFDEHGHRRPQHELAEVFKEARAGRTLYASPSKGRVVYVLQISLPDDFRIGMPPENRGELLDAVRWAADGSLSVEVNAPEAVAMSLYSQPSGRHVLHLVNYDENHAVSDIEVTLQLASERRVATVALLSPDQDGTRTLAVNQSVRTLRFVVGRLEVYGLVAIES